MLPQEYLTLRLVRLKPAEKWATEASGLLFIFVKAGVGKCFNGTGTQVLGPGDVLALSVEPEVPHGIASSGEMVFWCFSVSLEHLYPLFSSGEICLLHDVNEVFKAPRFYPASGKPAAECHQLQRDVPPQINLDQRSQLLRAVAVLLSLELRNARGHRVGFVRVEEHMIQVFEKLSVNELLRLSVGELASKFSCSRRHLNRLFHQYFGFSVSAMRMEMRLLKAVSLLRDPNAKVISVAEQCGFNHLGLFNTCFRRRFGMSPGQWRKSNAQGRQYAGELPRISRACPLNINGFCAWAGAPDPDNRVANQTPVPHKPKLSAAGMEISGAACSSSCQ